MKIHALEVFEQCVMFRRPIFQIPPVILSTSSKNHVFEGTFDFQGEFLHSWSTSDDQNFRMTKNPKPYPTRP